MSVAETVRHDLFCSYAADDAGWVEGFLLKKPNLAGITYLTETAFEFGKPRVKAFEETIRRSRKVLLIISPFFLADGTQEFVRILGISHGLQTSSWWVIPLFLGPVGRVKISPALWILGWLDAIKPKALRCICIARAGPRYPPPRLPIGSLQSLRVHSRHPRCAPVRCRGSLRRL